MTTITDLLPGQSPARTVISGSHSFSDTTPQSVDISSIRGVGAPGISGSLTASVVLTFGSPPATMPIVTLRLSDGSNDVDVPVRIFGGGSNFVGAVGFSLLGHRGNLSTVSDMYFIYSASVAGDAEVSIDFSSFTVNPLQTTSRNERTILYS